MFGLKSDTISAIRSCFVHYPEIERVILYGSRAMGTFKKGSDIDLCIVGEMNFDALLRLETQLDDLLLPYKIDLSIYANLQNPSLLAHIKRVGQVFYERDAATNPSRDTTRNPTPATPLRGSQSAS